MKNKTANIIFGLIFSILGLAAFGIGMKLILVPGVAPAELEKQALVNTGNCSKSLREMFKATTGDKIFTVREAGLQDAEVKLAKASLAISLCRGYELTKFCIGTGCKIEGMEMTLNPRKEFSGK